MQNPYRSRRQPGERRSQGEAVFISELKEAWNHHRHMEETRIKYINFFIAIFIATIGFVISILKDGLSEKALVSSALMLALLFVVSLLTYASMIRIGFVLMAYEKVMSLSRAQIYKDYPVGLDVWRVRQYIPAQFSSGIFLLTRGAQYLVEFLMLILVIGEAAFAWLLAALPARSPPGFILVGGLFVMTATILAVMVTYVRRGIAKARR